MNEYFTLNNGVKIPSIGFGTWQTPDGETAENVVSFALKNGYSHVDGAAVYENENGVGRGIKASGVPRNQLFITSKVWNTERGYESTKKAFKKSLADLGLEYLDLYLIHWPANLKQFPIADEINLETWRAMTELYKEGKIKAIGVSNFQPHHLKPLMKTEIKPMVNQIEYHPGCLQEETVRYCKENDIVVEAWSPLGSGRVLSDEKLIGIAEHYSKSVAQLCVRFALQNGIVPLPKSVTEERILENRDVMDFEITKEDMAEIIKMGEFGGSGLQPDEIDF